MGSEAEGYESRFLICEYIKVMKIYYRRRCFGSNNRAIAPFTRIKWCYVIFCKLIHGSFGWFSYMYSFVMTCIRINEAISGVKGILCVYDVGQNDIGFVVNNLECNRIKLKRENNGLNAIL